MSVCAQRRAAARGVSAQMHFFCRKSKRVSGSSVAAGAINETPVLYVQTTLLTPNTDAQNGAENGCEGFLHL